MPLREIILLVVVCFVWGGHMLVIRVTVADIPPLFYVATRLTLMVLILSPFLRWRPGEMLRVAAAGLFLAGLNYAFMFTGFQYATASAGSIAMELAPPFATILSVVFLKEQVGWRRMAGVALAFAGVALIALNPSEAGVGFGVGLIALAALSEATGSVLVKSIKRFRPIELLAAFSVVGAGVNWTGTLLFESGQWGSFAARPVAFSLAIAYSIFLASIFGHTSYYWLLQRRPVSMISPSLLLTTVFAVLLGVLILGEPLTAAMIAGGLMTILGVGIILLRSEPKSAATVAAGPEPHPSLRTETSP
ncbi:MAG: DMT family transporter [Pseudomonadota bacterium]